MRKALGLTIVAAVAAVTVITIAFFWTKSPVTVAKTVTLTERFTARVNAVWAPNLQLVAVGCSRVPKGEGIPADAYICRGVASDTKCYLFSFQLREGAIPATKRIKAAEVDSRFCEGLPVPQNIPGLRA